MAEKDSIMVRQKELKRLHVIHAVIEGAITQKDGAQLLSLSERQIRRIVRRIQEEGDCGIIHKSRGRPSGRKLSHKLKERIIDLYRTIYAGFGPTLFTEILFSVSSILSRFSQFRNPLFIKRDSVVEHSYSNNKEFPHTGS